MFLEKAAEWFTAIVTGVSAFIIWMQLRLDHERSRRLYAVELLREWTNKQNIVTSATLKLVRTFSDDQCEALAAEADVRLRKEQLKEALDVLTLEFPNVTAQDLLKDGELQLSGRYRSHCRFQAVHFLNLLESILAAWNSGIARADIIEAQFQFLRTAPGADLQKLRRALQNIRGQVDPFPSISNFLAGISPQVAQPLKLVDRLPWK